MPKKCDLQNVNWPSEAKRGGYQVKTVAQNLKHSTRAVEHFFGSECGESPNCVFTRWRLALVCKLARKRGKMEMNGDEIAKKSSFSSRASLRRFIAREAGCTLEQLRTSNGHTSHKGTAEFLTDVEMRSRS